MTSGAEPPTLPDELPTRDVAAGLDGPMGRSAERLALGLALEERVDDIVRWCQSELVKHSRARLEDVNAPWAGWETTSLAVHSIANWLKSGASADTHDRATIASLGAAAARQREMHMLSSPFSVRVQSDLGPLSVPQTAPGIELSVALLTRFNLWWSEATRTVLAEEAVPLKISQTTLDEACAMVVKSCHSSLVLMAKQFDAAFDSLYERMSHLALHDSLTGLVNRATLVDWLDRAIARLARHPGGLVVAFMDLDNFKEVNDAYGHACGDEVLIEVASRLSAQMRPEDVVARFGGDEFVAVFADLSNPLDAAARMAERLHSIVIEPVRVNEEDLHMTISVGIAVVEGPGSRSDDVLAQADAAMYSVKQTGRNKIVTVPGGPPHRSTSTGPIDPAERRRNQGPDSSP
ncbi:MAG TPA: GGDEF domain-containing protein [Acidimicrobiales bacterium]|nr:GGDEF domain-containing protein [Acidimicrobiales bacterium]